MSTWQQTQTPYGSGTGLLIKLVFLKKLVNNN